MIVGLMAEVTMEIVDIIPSTKKDILIPIVISKLFSNVADLIKCKEIRMEKSYLESRLNEIEGDNLSRSRIMGTGSGKTPEGNSFQWFVYVNPDSLPKIIWVEDKKMLPVNFERIVISYEYENTWINFTALDWVEDPYFSEDGINISLFLLETRFKFLRFGYEFNKTGFFFVNK